MSLDGTSTLSMNASTNKPTKESMNKIIRTKRKENDLRRMLHSYDLTKANPNQVKRLAEVFDDIGTRSSCPTHLIYSPKKMSLKAHNRAKPEYIKGLKDHAADKINYLERLENARGEFAEKIERIKDLIETDVEDIDFLKQQMQAQKERIASHQDAPRAQERDAEAGMILPVTGYNNASQLNKRMVEKSLAQLVKRIMNKRAEVNDAIGENNKIKYVIDNLRRERTTYIGIIKDLHDELSEIKSNIKNDEEYIEQTNNDRKEMNEHINNAQNEREEMIREHHAQLDELEEKRLEEIRLDKIAQEADEEKRRKERWRKRNEAKARRNKAREEHQRQHDAHMKSKKGAFDFGNDSTTNGGDDHGGSSMVNSSLNGGGSALDSSLSLNSLSHPSGGSLHDRSTHNVGGAIMEEMYGEWTTTWNLLLDGTNIRHRFLNEAREVKESSDSSLSSKRRASMRPGRSTSVTGSPIASNQATSTLTMEELNLKMRNRLVYELRSNADANFQLMQQLNELKNNRDALNTNIRDISITLRQLERSQSSGGADEADMSTVRLIKKLENDVMKLEIVVSSELDQYNSNLMAVDTFCDEITTCYLRTGAGGGESKEESGEGDGSGGGGDDGGTKDEETPASPSGGRRRSSSGMGSETKDDQDEKENSKNNPSKSPMNESTILASEVNKLKPQHYRALDNLKAIEQHVKNVILQYAAQPMILHNSNTNSSSGLAGSLSSTNNLLSPHQQAMHAQSQLSPKERENLIVSRLGSMSSITSTRSIEQKIPKVDIPDDMEGAFGFDSEMDVGGYTPFLRDEVSDQLQRQLAAIKEETNARRSMAASLGTEFGSQQQSAVSSAGLIDTAHKIRAEKVSLLLLLLLSKPWYNCWMFFYFLWYTF